MIYGSGNDGRLADGRGQQVRANDVAGDKVSLLAGYLVEGISVNQAAAVVQ